jgi:hypothetical protein
VPNIFERPGSPTGPGKISSRVSTSPSIVCTYDLFNFNIDGNQLKPEHTKFLDEHLVPRLKSEEVHAKLTGTTSKSGEAEYNRQLSLSRVLRVKEYLRSRGIPESKIPGPDIRAAGEDLSKSTSNEDEVDRAVQIIIATGIKPLPIWPVLVFPISIYGEVPVMIKTGRRRDTPRKEKWAIRTIFGGSFSASVSLPGKGIPGVSPSDFSGASAGMLQYHFLLVHQRSRMMSQCTFAGPAGSAGLGGLLGASITEQSKTWNEFETAPGTTFDDLDGFATWTESPVATGTALSLGPNRLTLLQAGVTVEVDTGRTWGFPSSSASAGKFSCRKPVPLNLP